MIYTTANTIDIGRPVEVFIDANGLRWTHCKEVDTETGRIVRVKLDAEGRLQVNDKGNILMEEVFTAAPIIAIFREQT